MADHRISVLSTEYVVVPLLEVEVAGEPYDPTNDLVKMAFTALTSDPTLLDFKSAIWQTDEQPPIVRYSVACLVGPAAVVLSKGMYAVWVKITDNPEVPVQRSGTLQVY